MEAELARQGAVIADLQSKLAIYEGQQSEWKAGLAATVETEVDRLTQGLRQVHTGTAAMVEETRNRIIGLEKFYSASKPDKKERTGMLHVKDMKPDVLKKEEDWRR